MSINLTLIVQMLVFALLIWFTMKFVWPIILGAMEERSKRIADGLAAAQQGQKDLAQAKARADDAIREARSKAVQIVDQAQHRANELIDQAKATAITEGDRLIAAAQQQTRLDATRAREELRKEVAALAVQAAQQLLEREIDAATHAELLNKVASELGNPRPKETEAERAARIAVESTAKQKTTAAEAAAQAALRNKPQPQN